MTSTPDPQKGRKTTITWMIAAAVVVALLAWRILREPSPGPDAATAATVAQVAPVKPTVAPSPAANDDKAAPPKVAPAPPPPQFADPGHRPVPLGHRAEKPGGDWTDVDASPGGASVHVIALHGRGDTGRNFSAIARHFDPTIAWRFLEGPLPWADGKGRRWFDSAAVRGGRGDTKLALQFIRSQLEKMPEPVALLGFSQGCMTILHLLARGDHKVGAAVCVGGYMVGDIEFANPRHVPILFVHAADDPIATPEKVKESIQAFENRGFPTEEIEYGGGHKLPLEEARRMGHWLIERVRGG